jgi:hypothetical protein
VKITKDQKAVAANGCFGVIVTNTPAQQALVPMAQIKRQSCSDRVRGHPSRTFGTWSRPLVSGTKAWKVLLPAALSSVFNGPSGVGAYATGLAGFPGGSQRSARTGGEQRP